MKELSASSISEKLNISSSYLYTLKNKGIISVKKNKFGKYIWDENVMKEVKCHLYKSQKDTKEPIKNDKPEITKINNRRYLGNKYKLLKFIRNIIDTECGDFNTFADIFSGTGAVASAFIDKKLITNDIMYSNYICHKAWFSNESFNKAKIVELIYEYNTKSIEEENYMTENFSDTFFSKKNCMIIGHVREDIESKFTQGLINERERALLITSLLYAMDKVANTCGHYDAYRKSNIDERKIELRVPEPNSELNIKNEVYNEDANELVKKITADVVYIDPPYNSRQYSDAYHLLENIATWAKPEVHGIARKMDRSNIKSKYCTVEATKSFEQLIDDIDAKYIVLSYNNMSEKGNDRSNAKIKDIDIMRILERKGNVKVFSSEYKPFTAGKSNVENNEERIFLCKCYNKDFKYIQSPLNYTGGKYKLLPQILGNIPNSIDNFIDIFSGGCNVGINVECNHVLFNDSNEKVIGLFNLMQRIEKKEIFSRIENIIEKYKLSNTYENSYAYYSCNSSSGLGNYNKKGYTELREDLNNSIVDDEYYIKLFVLIVYSFNNHIRFNNNSEFNLPVGKRDFNSKMRMKLSKFIDEVQKEKYTFVNGDFSSLDISMLNANSLVYVDPPYLITCAPYNEQGGWSVHDEKRLYLFLDDLNARGVKFILSNVLENKGNVNMMLQEWIQKNKSNYRVIELKHTYSNSSYNSKNKDAKTKEIIVLNYDASEVF